MPTSPKEQTSRPDVYVLARVIQSLRDKGKTNRTALAASSGLPYDRLIRYLTWMSERGLVESDLPGSSSSRLSV